MAEMKYGEVLAAKKDADRRRNYADKAYKIAHRTVMADDLQKWYEAEQLATEALFRYQLTRRKFYDGDSYQGPEV